MLNDSPQLFELIRFHSGISRSELFNLSGFADKDLFQTQIRNLLDLGLITEFKEKLYPNIRFIGIYTRNSDDMVEEIRLLDIIALDLQNIISPHENDLLYFDGYVIDDSNKNFFEKKYNLRFEFDRYNYYLLCAVGDAAHVHHDHH